LEIFLSQQICDRCSYFFPQQPPAPLDRGLHIGPENRVGFALQALASFRVCPPPNLPINVENFIDARIIKTGFNPETCRSNFLVKNILERGELSHAREVFDQMPQKNTISTNMMISGYVKSSNLSRELVDGMVDRTSMTWIILIGGYTKCNQF
jgi:hypothetical protein